MVPGTALTGRFHFSTASLLIAPMAQQKAMNPLTHSVGLVKNVRVEATPSKVDLTQGIMNDVVASVNNGMPITGSGEVYEYTSRNLAYGLSQDPTGLVDMAPPQAITAAVAAGATSFTTAAANTFAVGDWGYIQEALDDQIHIFKVSAISTNTVTFTGYPVPTGLSFTTNARVGEFNKIDADPAKANNYFAVRVVGIAVDLSTPVVLHFPKCRITKGFAMGFSSDNFSNLPFEWTPLVPVATDPGYDADFRQRMQIFNR
ncbi:MULTISPECIES: hypothetical protein [Methylobacterium]|jgi:hypothetical protein|uniref:Uncharacterized protein n=1 Tax=Methylobacterium jeotgali TaxID=381630 RepID=A0ABQ4T0I1_9HYPH|nr:MULTISPECIES: hypothetical protein [Methylobacterium]PIU05299.1 MAG: hypothetical protein COT56_16050 [Methylobacterium sp. CG09_land_8_20_14_0_10_71_15]PIU12361.1 MAG: hypothetical protein COT28_15330 [Methylobacterium sp. CG08_land_8_20_14_0_20_71_15]GBU16872.1 hypothetical protein AwMethylo_10870 [Methylobacterium sp.]GJE07981.1 hypothetical protein AOPFMNJM_3313 [Methylobacterium jeotgali]